MGRVLRLWVLGSALLETLLFSGCLLGWSSLSPILVDVGVMSKDCHSGLELPGAQGNNTTNGDLHIQAKEAESSLVEKILRTRQQEPRASCITQERYLHLGFTLGAFCVWGGFLPLQLLLGYAQIRSLRQIGGALVSVSYLMLAYCLINPKTLSLFLPFALVAQGLGGSCVLFSSLLLPHIMEDAGPVFSALVIASFSASAAIFTIIKVIYYSGAPIVAIILGYGSLSCAMFLNSTLCWSLNLKGKEEDTMYSVSLRLNCYEAMKKQQPREAEWCQKSLKLRFQESLRDRERILSLRRTMSFKRPDAPAPTPLLESLTSPTFLLHLLAEATLITWIYFYISSVNSHLQDQVEEDEAELYSSVFGALQMLGLFAAPLVFILLHNHRIRKRPIRSGHTEARMSHKIACSVRRLSMVYALRCLLVIGFGVCCLLPSPHIQVVSFILHVVIRASMFVVSSSLYRCMFPEHHYGALLGITTFISSILSLLQCPIFLLLTGPLQGEPFWIHATFLALSLAAVALPINLIIKHKRRNHHPLSRPIHIRPMPQPSQTKA
ncbi:large neutral amino acids transporter small subunit 4-like [Engystomops pustulosus]|uniref:large neutral amino acids transporter small subunit 4-like n=1 Tax=Engystomops pustulosus TaxID=76066 RepID=UPI003AFA6693